MCNELSRMGYELNGSPLPADSHLRLVHKRGEPSRAWVNGVPLKPGDTLGVNGIVMHVESDPGRVITLQQLKDIRWERRY